MFDGSLSVNSMQSIETKALVLNTGNVVLKTKDYATQPPTTDLHTLTVAYTSHSFWHMNIIHRRLSCMKRLRDRTVYNQTVVHCGITPINMQPLTRSNVTEYKTTFAQDHAASQTRLVDFFFLFCYHKAYLILT